MSFRHATMMSNVLQCRVEGMNATKAARAIANGIWGKQRHLNPPEQDAKDFREALTRGAVPGSLTNRLYALTVFDREDDFVRITE